VVELELVCSVADDFVLWPERLEVLQHRISRRVSPTREDEGDRAYENLIREFGQANLVGRDPVFMRIAKRLSLCAQTDFPVLITGETGSGKEVFARAIHFLGKRRNHPFIPVDCAGLPDHLLENELFGHVRGAYTDAHGEQRGMAALAEGGTLFLDEIDSFSLMAQAKLLRFLQDRHFKPLGSEHYAHSDVKIVAASNRALEQLVAEKQFRVDLYYRLAVLHLELPPLRQRPTDIPLLAQHFLMQYQPDGMRKSFSAGALSRLSGHPWPGNVRELINVVQRAIAFSQGPQINAADLALPDADAPREPAAIEAFRQVRQKTLQKFEQDYIRDLLGRHGGNITHAAREAGKERRAFGRLVKRYGLKGGKSEAGHA
jgi:DNA-binding NtrC family response regulator